MGEVIAVHSFKGGTGKTVVVSNLALVLALRGRSVVLLDFDFKAPSLFTVFHPKRDFRYWLNDWFQGGCSMPEALADLSGRYGLPEKRLQVGFADPSGEAIKRSFREHLTAEAQGSFLQHFVRDLETLRVSGVDFVLLDTSPGFSYNSLTAILSCERLVLVTRCGDLDLEGTREFVKTIYDAVLKKRRVLLVVNHAPPETLLNPGEGERLRREIASKLNLSITAFIPCYCELMTSRGRNLIVVDEDPRHGFSKNVGILADRLLCGRGDQGVRVDNVKSVGDFQGAPV